MKNSLLLLSVALFLFTIGCNKSELTSPPAPTVHNVITLSGTYNGLFYESNNGVDSNGVFKNDTSYAYSLNVQELGNNQVVITHGPVTLPQVTLDATNHFSFEDFNHDINGYFVNDSLYLSSNSLNGNWDTIYFVGDWFVIQKLSFAGKKVL